MRAQRTKWFGHVVRKLYSKDLKVAVEWKPTGKGPRENENENKRRGRLKKEMELRKIWKIRDT